MNILVLDNYDSFTFNLVHLLEAITGQRVSVFRNNEIALEQVAEYDKIILSPGPGIPAEAGLLLPIIEAYASSKSILGVCLGHQAIGEAFGAKLINLENVYHGIATEISTNEVDSPLFYGLENTFEVGRYHSWIVSDEAFPAELQVTARDRQGQIMAMQHVKYAVQGVQFHPESVLTPSGRQIISNWLKI